MNSSPFQNLWPDFLFEKVVDALGWKACCINQWEFNSVAGAKHMEVYFFFEPPNVQSAADSSAKTGFFRVVATGAQPQWGLNGLRHAIAAVRNVELFSGKEYLPLAKTALEKALNFVVCDKPEGCIEADGCAPQKTGMATGTLDTLARSTVILSLDSRRDPDIFQYLAQFHNPVVPNPLQPFPATVNYMSNGAYALKVIKLMVRDFKLAPERIFERVGRKPRKSGLSIASTRIAKELIRLSPMKPLLRWNEKMKDDPNGGGLRKKNQFEDWLKPKEEKHGETGHMVDHTVESIFKFFHHTKKPCASKEFRKAVMKAGKILAKQGISRAFDSLKKNAEIIAKKSLKRQIAALKKSAKGRVRRALLKKLGLPRIPKKFPSKKVLIKKILKKGFRSLVHGAH